MRRAVGLGVLLLALGAALILWRCAPDRPASEVGAARRLTAPPRSPSVDADWLGQPGVPPRRIAGIVRRGGEPAPLANVKLYLGPLLVADELTDGHGRFDLGPRPAAGYTVTA